MVTSAAVRPFRIEIAQSQLDDLRARLSHTRLPNAIVHDWSDGTDTAYLRELLAYWRDTFDWRAQEARLNAFPHFKVRVAERDVHVLHARGSGVAPLPLILSHGWPGSFAEMLDLVPRLTNPERFGGDPRDAFDVVVPSLPGYGFSERPTAPGTTAAVIADVWAELMTTLGYERFGAQGGDWGSAISTHLGIQHAERVAGVHLNYVFRAFLPSRRSLGANADPDETAYFDGTDRWYAAEGGYSHLQATKPQTLAYALGDSPAGLAAYIVEKFRTWSDCGGNVESVFSKDTLLTNVAIYCLRKRSALRCTCIGNANALRCARRACRRQCRSRSRRFRTSFRHRRGGSSSAFSASNATRRCRAADTSPRSSNRSYWQATLRRSSGRSAKRPGMKSQPLRRYAPPERRRLRQARRRPRCCAFPLVRAGTLRSGRLRPH